MTENRPNISEIWYAVINYILYVSHMCLRILGMLGSNFNWAAIFGKKWTHPFAHYGRDIFKISRKGENQLPIFANWLLAWWIFWISLLVSVLFSTTPLLWYHTRMTITSAWKFGLVPHCPFYTRRFDENFAHSFDLHCLTNFVKNINWS